MKTTVFGLFDEMTDAHRVLEQLVGSPLDLDGIVVLHRDADTQRALRSQVGLPARRTLGKASLLGALLGAAAGAALGADALAALGPLLAAGLGVPVGAALGAAAAAFSDDSRLPRAVSDELLAAVAQGATLVSVRTTGLPTAHAVRDLFEAGGSRLLDSAAAARSDPEMAAFPSAAESPPTADGPATDAAPPSDARESAASVGPAPDHHALFAPPWRRTPFAARPRGGYPLDESGTDPAPDSTSDASEALPNEPKAPPAERLSCPDPDDGPDRPTPPPADA